MFYDKRSAVTDLDFPLLNFTNDPKDVWTVRDAVRGAQIFGGIGSGKSSGSGRYIAKTFLNNGFGGLVLCAKPDERPVWEKYAAETGRSKDLIIFSKNSEYEFNPLQYETEREGEGAGEVFNLSFLFMEIYKMGSRFSGSGGGSENDRYWDNALRRCLNRMIQLLKLADEEISIENMRYLLSSAPLENEVDSFYNGMSDDDVIEWGKESYCVGCILKAGERCSGTDMEGEFSLIKGYFMREFARLDDKSKSIVKESFLGLAEPLLLES